MIIKYILSHWSYFALGICLGIILILGKSCSNQVELTQLEKNKNDSTHHKAVKIQLEKGVYVFRVKALEVTTQQLKNDNSLLGLRSAAEIKSLKQQVGNLSKIVSYYRGNITLDGSFSLVGKDSVVGDSSNLRPLTTDLNPGDSAYNKLLPGGTVINLEIPHIEKVFDWQNKYLRLHAVYNPLFDSLKVRYFYNADFTLVGYRKGGNIFKRGQLVADVKFSDDAIRVGEFRAIEVKEDPPKRFSIGPALVYNPFNNTFQPGISLQWALIKF